MKKYLRLLTVLAIVLSMCMPSAGLAWADSELSASASAPEQPVKISISGAAVVLDKYFAAADGTDQTPQVTEVYMISEQEGTGPASKTVLDPADYTVEYWRYKYIASDSKIIDKNMEKVETCTGPGEYKAVVTAAPESPYQDSCEALFTITGQPQKITLSQTLYKKTTKSTDFTIKAQTTGDGTGLGFYSSNEAVARVSDRGRVEITGCGEASITVFTQGDILSQPSQKTVTVRVSPAKTYWKAKTGAVRKGTAAELTYNQVSGASRYQVMYSTSKSFKESQTLTKKTKKTQTTIKGLEPGKNYYVRVRAMYEFTDSRGNKRTLYGNWSSVKTLRK